MKQEELEILAAKYWEGATTRAEEDRLRNALKSQEVPAEYEVLADYLKVTETIGVQLLDDAFDRHVMAKLEKRPSRNRRITYIRSMAATLVLLIAAVFLFKDGQIPSLNPTPSTDEFVDTYTDSKEAYKEVKNALLFVSKNMNEGMTQVQALGEFYEAKQKLSAN